MDELIRIWKIEVTKLLANNPSLASTEAFEAFEDAHLARLAAHGVTEADFEAALEAHLNEVNKGVTYTFDFLPSFG